MSEGGKRKPTAWMKHVKETMGELKGEKSSMGKKWFSHVLKTAKKTYKKHGGGDEGMEGGKRRKHSGKKTRRHRK
ncbi:MAG: hypothetical protein EB127_16730 [Alphaproteobacteria bacterium]|nr:hypothetical protein [Alphaproteobacteria bacterium]